MVLRIIILTVLTVFILGCSTTAKVTAHPKACEILMDEGAYNGWVFWVLGVTTQQGSCALFPDLSFETGLYYSAHQEKIIEDVQEGRGLKNSPEGLLRNLAYVAGCRKPGVELFIKRLHENKEYVFGKYYENWSRTVMLRAREMVERDDVLVGYCR